MWCSVERERVTSWHSSPWLTSPYQHFCTFLLQKQEQDYVTQKAMRKQNDVNCNWHNLSCNCRQLFHLCCGQGLFYVINLGWLLFVRACRPESTCFLPELLLPKLTLHGRMTSLILSCAFSVCQLRMIVRRVLTVITGISKIDIPKLIASVIRFRIRKLPKALKEWQAFLDLKKTIDDFSECCPLLEMMAHKAMKQRHWERISSITSVTLDVESETFQLRQLMSAPLLPNKEDIEVSDVGHGERKDEFRASSSLLAWKF